MIGYRPTVLESKKISHIARVFDLKNCSVLRELMTGRWTLDELFAIARKTSPGHYGFTLPYLKKTFDPAKSIDTIVKDGERLYVQDMLGRKEHDEWEFIKDEKNISYTKKQIGFGLVLQGFGKSGKNFASGLSEEI